VVQFEAPLYLSEPGLPRSIINADLDRDGTQDLAVANHLGQNVSIFLGKQAGRFLPAVNFAVTGRPQFLITANLNEDANPDLIVGNTEPASIDVLLGDGSGGFSLAHSYSMPSSPTFMAQGDFNTDGNVDLVVASAGVCVLLGDGAGGLGSPTCFGTGGPSSLTVADFNSDGRSDVISAVGDHLAVTLGDGIGGLGSEVDLPIGVSDVGISSVTAADFNNDGNPDLAVGKHRGPAAGYGLQGDIYILLGDGTGAFGVPVTFGIVDGPNALVVDDFNSDGNLDLAVGNLGADTISVLLGDGSGGFAPQSLFVVGESPNAIASNDFNGDGKVDLAITKREPDAIAILFGNGNGVFGAPRAYSSNKIGTRGLVVADFNSDGRSDSAVTNTLGNSVSIFLADGLGGFEPANDFPVGGNPFGVAAADFNSDGKTDLVVTTTDSNSSTNNVFVLYGDGLGHLSIPNIIAQVSSAWSVAANDLNNDGHPDIAVPDNVSNTVVVILNTGPGTFSPPTSYAVGSEPRSIATGDFNGDGYRDITTSNEFSADISILMNDGQGGFSAPTSFSVGPQPTGVIAADLDRDSYCDLAVAVNSSVALFRGTPSGLVASTSLAANGVISVATADLDGDNKLDLIASTSLRSIIVFFGDGSGSFGPSASFPVGGPRAIGVTDLNSDGKSDLVISNYAGISALLNTCGPNTPSGTDVVVESGTTILVFADVTSAGQTTVTSIDPSTIGEIPGGLGVSELIAYQITSTARFSGAITIGFAVPGPMSEADFNALAILHNEGGTLVNVTATSPARSYSTLTIYAATTSLSPFYLVRRDPHAVPLFDQTKAHRIGSTVPIKIGLFNSSNANVSSSGTVLTARDLKRVGGTTSAPVIDSGNANPDNNFRYDPGLGIGGGYILNLGTRGFTPGTYLLSFYAETNHAFFYTVRFEVK